MKISRVEFTKDYSDMVNFTGSELYAEMDINGKTISTVIMTESGKFLFPGGRPDFDLVCKDLAETAQEECADMLSLEELDSIYDTIPEDDEGNDRLNAAIEEFADINEKKNIKAAIEEFQEAMDWEREEREESGS